MSDIRDNVENKAKAADETPSALQTEASNALNSRIRVVGDRAELLDTRASDPKGTKVGPSDPNAEISVTVMVKSKASDQEINDTVAKIANGKEKPLTDAEFNSRFGADPAAMARVEKFAKDNGLTVDKADANSGQIKLKGQVNQFDNAFGVQLNDYKDGQFVSRERSGNISVPRALENDIQGVFGLDNRKQAEPHFRKGPIISPKDGASSNFLPNEVADAYNFPKESMGAGQSVGIIELGGGIDTKDNSAYYQAHGFKEPSLQIVGVDGATNTPGGDADGEVALDAQVIGAVAPDANQQLLFAPNSDQGFVDAITRATFPEAGEKQNTAISISWGAAESNWTDQAVQNMDMAFKKAALKGISVFAASGDNGAKDNTDKFSADFPSSDPYVTGTGGTELSRSGKEVVWNDGGGFFGGSTGGGISDKFPVPDFQKDTKMPVSANPDGKAGRGDPDIAGDAAPSTGYIVRVGGQEQAVGGTSAVAPLYAALTMRLNGALGHPVGYLNPFLYQQGNAGSGVFKDITEGNNNGYTAGPGWDAATGWGAIDGQKFLDALRKAGK
jgi:kumamolisin